MNKKQKKLLLECVEHVMEWERHMGRVSKTKIVKGMFGLGIPKTTYLKKYLELKNICKILNA